MNEILSEVIMQEVPTNPGGQSSNEEFDTSRQKQQSALSRAIIEDLAGFDLCLRSQRGPIPFIIDMYITKPDNPAAIVPLTQDTALKRFRAQIAEIDHDPYQLGPGRELIRENLVSVVTFCEEVTRVENGMRKMPYESYLRLVAGVKPRLIPFVVLQADRRVYADRLRATGFHIPPSEDLDDIKAAQQGYQDRNRVTSRPLVETFFRRFFQRYRAQLGYALGEDLSSVDFKIIWKERNAFWMMWERVEMDGDRLWANWHPRHRENWDMGTIERYAIHEPAHFIAAYLMRREIEAGRLDPAVGVFPIPGAGCFKEEGVAQTLDELAGLQITLDGRLSVASYRLEKRALNNALYLAENGVRIGEVVGMVRDYMPLKGDEEIMQLVEEGTTRPFERAYLPLYGLSDYDLREVVLRDKLGEVGIRSYLPQLLRTPMTRDKLMKPTLDLEPKLEPFQS